MAGESVPRRLCYTVMSARGGPAAEGLQGGVATVRAHSILGVSAHKHKKGEGSKHQNGVMLNLEFPVDSGFCPLQCWT